MQVHSSVPYATQNDKNKIEYAFKSICVTEVTNVYVDAIFSCLIH